MISVVYLTILLLFFFVGEARCNLSRERRMVLGRKVEMEEWPFAAWLVKERSAGYPRYCGASLIEENWVVTAAHCVDTIVNKPWVLTVRIGSVKRLLMKHQQRFKYNVTKIYLYPGYVSNMIPNDDIALIKLSRPVPVNRYTSVKPVRIALWKILDEEREDFRCRAAGWGKHQLFKSLKELKEENAKPSKYLKEIQVPLSQKSSCIAAFETIGGSMIRNKTAFWDKMMCGGSKSPKIGTACLHDSGAPLVCKDKYSNVDLHGITIAIHGPDIQNTPCAPGKQIMIFIRISYYARWILSVVNKEAK